jgi:DNA-binding MarR family transcriptional regulator
MPSSDASHQHAPREPSAQPEALTDQQYKAVEIFRHTIRRILAESEQACAECGVTTQRFQAMITIRTFEGESGPSVGDIADRLLLRHHSAVELVGRLEAAGLVARHADPQDRRRVLLALTPLGAERLEDLARVHLAGLSDAKAALAGLDDQA